MFKTISNNASAIFSISLLAIPLASCNAQMAQKIGASVVSGIAVECIMGRCGENAQAARPTLSFRSACGSAANGGTNWYTVVSNSQSIDVVKTKYCGDAFITADGNLQVASFTSRFEAENLASILSKLTGQNFWVLNK